MCKQKLLQNYCLFRSAIFTIIGFCCLKMVNVTFPTCRTICWLIEKNASFTKNFLLFLVLVKKTMMIVLLFLLALLEIFT